MKFAKQLEVQNDVSVYAKLPDTYKIPVPDGTYNPDWAIIMNYKDYPQIYFVAETKGSTLPEDLRGLEELKIGCAKKLFKKIDNKIKSKVSYSEVKTYDDLCKEIDKAMSETK